MLAAMPLPKSVLTNSPLEHALRILEYLGIGGHFERVFDIRFNGLSGKPSAEVYERVLRALNRKPQEVLLIDNRLDYLLAFREMGGQVLLVDEGGVGGQAPNGSSRQPASDPALSGEVPRIRDIMQLPAYLGR